MVSKREAQDCLDSTEQILLDATTKEPTPDDARKAITRGIFIAKGILECLWDIRDSLEKLAENTTPVGK